MIQRRRFGRRLCSQPPALFIEGQHFICRGTGDVNPASLRIDYNIGIVKRLLLPFRHSPLTNKLTLQIEYLYATVAQVGYVNRITANGHACRIVKLSRTSSLLTPLRDRIAGAVHHDHPRPSLINDIQITLWSNRNVTRSVKSWRRSTPLRHYPAVLIEFDQLLID